MSESDETLAERSRRGDRVAFEELVRRAGRGLFVRLFLQTGDAHLAEDLAQDTLLTAWRSIGKLADPRRFNGWLRAIADSTAIDAARRRARLKRSGPPAHPSSLTTVAARSASPPEILVQDDERNRALEVLRALPEEYRVPLSMRYLAGADYQTISRELALTNGSLRGLLSRGMAMMREEMKTE